MSPDHTIRLPGGALYYRMQGHGPPLMLIGGGPSNADTLSALAADLAGAPDGDLDHGYTVVTYDRRGYSRSHLGVPLAELPGHHAGMIQYPAEFAARLRELLPSVR